MAKPFGRGRLPALALTAVLGTLLPALAAAQSTPLTLEEAYRQARDRNPRLAAAQAFVEARRAMEGSAGVPPDPEVQVGLMDFSLPGLDADMATSMAPGVLAMQMLPLGKLGLAGKVAEQSTSMSEADALETWWEVRSRVAMAFYEVWRADREILVMKQTLAWLENFQAVASSMYVSGEGQQSDVLKAAVEIARMAAEIKRMEAMRGGAAARLNSLIGRPAGTPPSEVTFTAQPLDLPPLDTQRAWAEGTRPMLDRGRTEVDQAQTRLALARREIWPDLSLGFGYGQRPITDEETVGTERMGSVMLGFSLPVFAGRRQLRMRDEASAMARMAEADLDQMRVEVDARLGELLADLDRARTLVELYRTQILPQADASVESALSSYRVGRVDFMAVVDAGMAKNRYEQELITLFAEYGTGVSELEMTIGRELPAGAALLAEELR